MTRAVCLACGAFKVGALNRCKCGHDPVEPEDQARHMLVSDHYLTEDQQLAVSDAVRAGEPVDFDEAEVAEFAETVRNAPGLPVWYALMVIAVPVTVLFVLMIASAVLFRACA